MNALGNHCSCGTLKFYSYNPNYIIEIAGCPFMENIEILQWVLILLFPGRQLIQMNDFVLYAAIVEPLSSIFTIKITLLKFLTVTSWNTLDMIS